MLVDNENKFQWWVGGEHVDRDFDSQVMIFTLIFEDTGHVGQQ